MILYVLFGAQYFKHYNIFYYYMIVFHYILT